PFPKPAPRVGLGRQAIADAQMAQVRDRLEVVEQLGGSSRRQTLASWRFAEPERMLPGDRQLLELGPDRAAQQVAGAVAAATERPQRSHDRVADDCPARAVDLLDGRPDRITRRERGRGPLDAIAKIERDQEPTLE